MLAFSLSFQIGQLRPDPLSLLSPAKFYAENSYNFCLFIDRGDKTRNSVLMFINCLGLTWGQGWRQGEAASFSTITAITQALLTPSDESTANKLAGRWNIFRDLTGISGAVLCHFSLSERYRF